MSGSQDEIPPPPPPPSSQTPTQQTPHTVSTIKLPILKRGEYDIWAMKMEHYLAHTDYPIWEVIQNGNGPVSITTDTQGQIKVLPPRTVEEILAREKERKARTTLLMALPEDHLAKLHKITDAKEMWDAIASRFGGNDESKKMQKYILKQQFEGFSVSNSEGLHKGYDRFQSILSQLEIHGVEDHARVDSLTFDDLYNHLKSFENDVKGSSASSSSSKMWHLSLRTPAVLMMLYQRIEDLEQLEEFDLEEMNLKWQSSATIATRQTFLQRVVDQGKSDSRKRDAGTMEIRIKRMEEDLREQLSDASIEIKAYTQGLKKVEAQLVAHQQGQLCVETQEPLPEPTVNEPKVVSQPKVWSDSPIIDEYESDSEDEHVSLPIEEQETPSFSNQQVKSPRETVKNQFTHSKNPTVDKKGLRYGFTVRACFVCGSLSHLIRDCDFHEKRIAKQAELNNRMKRNSTVLTRTGKIPVNTARASGTNNVSTARHNFNRQAVPTNAAYKLVLLGGKGKLLLSPQQVVIGDNKDITGTKSPNTMVDQDYPHRTLQNKGIVDSGCSRHMTGNKAYLAEYQDFNGGPVAFRGSKGYITGKGKIKIGKLDFEDVCFVKELQYFNLFFVSQICDKKNKVLFTDSECLVLSPEFKLPDANQVLLRIPRQNNMYSFNLENIVPSGGLACLIAKATIDESNKWHRRLGHVNFKNLNKLVKGNLVRGLPSKIFQNDHTCVACQKGKQHKASCKAKSVSSISHSLQLLHMDLFGPTSVRSLNHKTYCLVITDDFSRFSWVFFLRTKDETSGILKDFIRQIENQLNQKVKTIRCDNGTEFKNKDFIEFCGSKGIKRESMIGSLMYLTASRPDIMFAVCACSRFQVTPKTSHLSAVKRIFRYLKGKPNMGLWYPKVSSFDLEAYSDSDYAGANLDRKSTIREAEYVAVASCCRQVLWIQNQMLDYGFNFMNIKIYIDNESTICIVKNPVYHSKTKHIAIRHHFIRDAYEKKLIQVLKIHTDDNVVDPLTKAFDVRRDKDGIEGLLLPKLFILWLAKVSTDSAKLIPLGKDSTAIETLKKTYLEKTKGNAEFHEVIDFLA
ncbi:putative ribonuclease H-like domain-containing protein [Tanacetum coccineum]|uniref:Ribonuclease H-like domain-containing protein n=1 Tax=Tanacetum coccineum TaxID=301880 RepID=A0ABQ4WF29_9ASTR